MTHETNSEPKRCQAINQNGSPCSALHFRDGWCRWHHPDLKDELREISSRGGKARSNAARAKKSIAGDLRDMRVVKAALMGALAKVSLGQMEPAQGQAMASIARALVAVSGVADFEDQLAEMRSEIAELTIRRTAS
jgi:hypothetical protein